MVHLFHESLSKDQPKTDNISNASQLYSADPVICQKHTEKLHQKENGVLREL
jgi:hypothetical protein